MDWRASTVTEHKLELPAYSYTENGKRLLAVAARHAGVDAEGLLTAIHRSPAMDFYVPSRTSRLTWRGTSEILVATNLAGEPVTQAFGSRGERFSVDLRSTTAPLRPIAMLQPAELKLERINLQPGSDGPTIQDPEDGDIGMEFVARPSGTAQSAGDTERLPQTALCDGDACGGGGGGGGTLRRTYLTRIQTMEICDNSNCAEGNEFEFRATVAATGATGFLRITGVPSTTTQARNDAVIVADPVTSGMINIAVKETDNWGDDHWLEVRYSPNYAGPVQLTASKLRFPVELKQNPYVGAFDPYRLALTFDAR